MIFSLTKFLTTIFCSSIIIILFGLLLHNSNLFKYRNIKAIYVCLAIIILRLLLPFEFGVEFNFYCSRILPTLVSFLRESFFTYRGSKVYICYMLTIIWALGAAIYLIKIALDHFQFRRTILRYSYPCSSEIHNAFKTVFQEDANSICLKQSPVLTTPVLIGLFSPTIVVPCISLPENDWIYVFSHESEHFYHKDILTKILCEFLCSIYWWNPFIYILHTQTCKVLEIRCDLAVANKLNNCGRIEYLECLVKIAKSNIHNAKKRFALPFFDQCQSLLLQRCKIVINRNGEDSSIQSFYSKLTIILIVCITVLSFLFVFEPITPPDDDSIEITKNNAFILKSGDNYYKVYVNGEYWFDTNNISDFSDVPVYK